jgi:hypothetical protein
MTDIWWIVGAIVVVTILAFFLVWSPLHAAVRQARLADAQRDFHIKREWLEAKFMTLASSRGKADTPRWADCEFDDDVAYVRNRSTGELAAFVAITVALEEDEATGITSHNGRNLRSGTAVFRFDHSHWKTDGVALLNLSPSEAVRYYQEDLEIVAHELARQG